jgi:hypothetical protein
VEPFCMGQSFVARTLTMQILRKSILTEPI